MIRILQLSVIFLFANLFITINLAYSQSLEKKRKTSYYTYIYKLNNKEARTICKKGAWKIDESFFHYKVDSFPTDSVYTNHLKQGYYLRTYANKNKQNIEFASVQYIDCKVITNHKDLCIQVYDSLGSIIADASVRVNNKLLPYDENIQSYIDKKSNKKGLLTIKHEDAVCYFNLERKLNNPAIKRITQQAIHKTPVKWVLIPVEKVAFIPYHMVKSLIRMYPCGIFNDIKRVGVKAYDIVDCWTAPKYCDYDYSFTRKFKGYCVSNKPKYMPGDTVKLKAFIVNDKGKPLNKKIDLHLEGIYYSDKKQHITTLKPYRNGAYSYEFVLHDSLDLMLDRTYELNLIKNKRKRYTYESFKYEEYELSSVNFNVNVPSENHYRDQPFNIVLSGKDENDLNLQDARIETIVTFNRAIDYFDDQMFIPDTLFKDIRKLKSKGNTKINLPDSLFPNANINYEINCKLLTSDNDSKTETKKVTYYHRKAEVDCKLSADSVTFFYLENNIITPTQAKLIGVDKLGNKSVLNDCILPSQIKINPYFTKYQVEIDNISHTVEFDKNESQLQCYSQRTTDSLFIQVDNPRKLQFTYFLYRKNKELINGSGTQLKIRKEVKN
ncbi:MAG: hypothetical protein MI922_30530, partial [Bacteroidales bacterium]|nr:hypothetical protein [Bacteroidales bacterium]